MKKFTFVIFALLTSSHIFAQATGSAVDLGLSVYWASCNVDANSPEDIGGYYAWGETETKSNYGDANYAYCDSETSFHDIGTDISGTQYDVARKKWGGAWRMPTLAEWNELKNNCTWTCIIRKTIFLAFPKRNDLDSKSKRKTKWSWNYPTLKPKSSIKKPRKY